MRSSNIPIGPPRNRLILTRGGSAAGRPRLRRSTSGLPVGNLWPWIQATFGPQRDHREFRDTLRQFAEAADRPPRRPGGPRGHSPGPRSTPAWSWSCPALGVPEEFGGAGADHGDPGDHGRGAGPGLRVHVPRHAHLQARDAPGDQLGLRELKEPTCPRVARARPRPATACRRPTRAATWRRCGPGRCGTATSRSCTAPSTGSPTPASRTPTPSSPRPIPTPVTGGSAASSWRPTPGSGGPARGQGLRAGKPPERVALSYDPETPLLAVPYADLYRKSKVEGGSLRDPYPGIRTGEGGGSTGDSQREDSDARTFPTPSLFRRVP